MQNIASSWEKSVGVGENLSRGGSSSTISNKSNSYYRSTCTRTIAHYRRIEQIGEGTYGRVFRAIDLSNGRQVALKKIRLGSGGRNVGDGGGKEDCSDGGAAMGRKNRHAKSISNKYKNNQAVAAAAEGIPRTVLREIKILRALKHVNMMEMFEVVTSKGCEELDVDDEDDDLGSGGNSSSWDKTKSIENRRGGNCDIKKISSIVHSRTSSDRKGTDDYLFTYYYLYYIFTFLLLFFITIHKFILNQKRTIMLI